MESDEEETMNDGRFLPPLSPSLSLFTSHFLPRRHPNPLKLTTHSGRTEKISGERTQRPTDRPTSRRRRRWQVLGQVDEQKAEEEQWKRSGGGPGPGSTSANQFKLKKFD